MTTASGSTLEEKTSQIANHLTVVLIVLNVLLAIVCAGLIVAVESQPPAAARVVVCERLTVRAGHHGVVSRRCPDVRKGPLR